MSDKTGTMNPDSAHVLLRSKSLRVKIALDFVHDSSSRKDTDRREVYLQLPAMFYESKFMRNASSITPVLVCDKWFEREQRHLHLALI